MPVPGVCICVCVSNTLRCSAAVCLLLNECRRLACMSLDAQCMSMSWVFSSTGKVMERYELLAFFVDIVVVVIGIHVMIPKCNQFAMKHAWSELIEQVVGWCLLNAMHCCDAQRMLGIKHVQQNSSPQLS